MTENTININYQRIGNKNENKDKLKIPKNNTENTQNDNKDTKDT